jgi:uncharacterized protein with beta-barrel porin domain
MSDSCGFDAGDRRVRAHRKRAADSGRVGVRRAYICVRASVFAVATLIFAAVFSGDAAAQGPGPGPGPGGGNNTLVPVATSNAHRSSQGTLFDVGSQFLQRFNAVYSFRTAASAANNPQGGGAEPSAEQRYRTWFEGYGLRSHTDARGDFTGDSRKTYGGVAGVGATVAPGLNLGISVDQSQSIIDVAGLAQRGRIDLTQVGAIAGYENGPWNINATLVRGFGDVHSSRVDVGGASTAAYQAALWAAMAELGYYWALPDNTRLVPKLTFDWMRTRTDAFTEIGGATPIAGSAVTASRVRMLIGGELGHSWLVDRRIMDVSVYARFVDNLSQNFGALQISDTTGVNLPQFVAGIRESNLGADAGAALSAKVTDAMRLYIVYDGRFRSNLTSHSGTVGAEFRW